MTYLTVIMKYKKPRFFIFKSFRGNKFKTELQFMKFNICSNVNKCSQNRYVNGPPINMGDVWQGRWARLWVCNNPYRQYLHKPHFSKKFL